MKNQVSDGNVMPWKNTTGATVLGGALVVAGATLGVLVADTPANEVGALRIGDVFELPKVPGAVFVQGEKLVWDVSVGAFDDSAAVAAAGDIVGGAIAWTAGANGEATCFVRLTPGTGTVTAGG